MLTETGVTTFRTIVGACDHWIPSKFYYSGHIGHRAECIYFKIFAFNLGIQDPFDPVGLGIDEDYAVVHVDRGICVTLGHSSRWTDMSMGRQ